MSRLSLIKNYHSLIYLHDLNLYYQSYSLSINCLIEWGGQGGGVCTLMIPNTSNISSGVFWISVGKSVLNS